MAIEHNSSKKKSACKEVDTYKVDGAAFLASVGEQKSDNGHDPLPEPGYD